MNKRMLMRTNNFFIMIILLVLLGSLSVTRGFAQEVAPVEGDEVSLSQLGNSEAVLRAPLATNSFNFSLPAHWALQNGAELDLHFTANTNLLGEGQGTLRVALNDVTLVTFVLEQAGDQTVTIPVPPEAWAASRGNGRHRLTVDFDSNTDCNSNIFAEIILHPDSVFRLPHEEIAPLTDLTQFPYPLFQRTFVLNDTQVVIPDKPTAAELQAALSVVAGIGQVTDSTLSLSLTPASELTTESGVAHHIILVGKPDTLPQINEIPWPAPLQDNAFDLAGATADDGIIQMAVSPWDSTKVVLLVSGQNDTALLKAAQAVSSGRIQPYTRSDVAVVSEVQQQALSQGEIVTDRTLTDLGYQLILVRGQRRETVSLSFQVPANSVIEEEASFNLLFAHSALLDFQQSRATVFLNGELIGSVRLSEESTNISQTSIVLPPMLVRQGLNNLDIELVLVPLEACNVLGDDGTWFTIYPDSTLHLPLQAAPEGTSHTYMLTDYPDPFALDFTLGQTAVIVPPEDVPAWQSAAQLILDISRRTKLPLANPTVAYAAAVPEEIRQTHDWIVIGQPSHLPLLDELGEALPVGFDTSKNKLNSENLPFVFRRPANVPLGYLELFTSPWSDSRHILLISGNSDEGVQAATLALADASKRSQMVGKVAVIDGEQVSVTNGRLAVETTEENIAADAPVEAITTVTAPALNNVRPAWILPLLILSILSIVGLVVGVAATSWRRRLRPE